MKQEAVYHYADSMERLVAPINERISQGWFVVALVEIGVRAVLVVYQRNI